jgi:hypothetical protein
MTDKETQSQKIIKISKLREQIRNILYINLNLIIA